MVPNHTAIFNAHPDIPPIHPMDTNTVHPMLKP